MTVKAVAEKLQVSPATVYSLIAAGKLKHYRIGMGRGCIRVSDDHLVEFLRGAESIPPSIAAPQSRPKLKHIRLS